MQILNEAVSKINAELATNLFSKSKRFTGSKMFNVCDQAIRTGTSTEEFPAVFDVSGNGVYAGIDDTFNLLLYHRRGGLTIVDEPGKGYGDNPAGSINTYSMTCIVLFNRKKLDMEADGLSLYIQRNFPYDLGDANFHYLSAWINSVILNSQQVFRAEYANTNYFLKPEHGLIAINYTIEGKPNLACFNRCPE